MYNPRRRYTFLTLGLACTFAAQALGQGPQAARTLPSTKSASTSQATPDVAAPDDWRSWRGPSQNGASVCEGLPTKWSAEENIVWRTPLPAWSGATPILVGERVFVVSPSAAPAAPAAPEVSRGQRGPARHPGGQELSLLCLARGDGALLWSAPLDVGNELHMKGNHASPSPVSDGERVYTVTGNGTVSAHSLGGERLWHMNLQETYGAFGLMWGYASSPALHGGTLFVQVLHGNNTDDPSYIVAFDAASGERVWRVERPTDAPRESPDAYTTPLIVERGGALQLVVTGGDYVTGHDLGDGRELWRVGGLNPQKAPNYRIVASSLLIGDLLVAPTRVRPITAFRLGANGRPTAEPVAWRWENRGGPDVPSPTTDGERLYLVDDGGMATCIDLGTGEAIWGPERTLDGTVSASPTLADGKLYITDESGRTAVLRAGPKFELLAVNELDGSYTLSTPVAAGGRLYVRTGQALYCVGAPQAEESPEGDARGKDGAPR